MNTLQPSQTVSEYVDLLLGNWVKSLHVPPGAFLLPAFLVHLVHFGYIFWYIWYIFWYLGTGSKASMYPSLWCIFATCQWSIKGFITRSIQPHLLYYLLLQALICSNRAHKGPPSNLDFFLHVCCRLLLSFCG